MDLPSIVYYNGKDAKKKFIAHICSDLQYMKKYLLRKCDFYFGDFEIFDYKNPIEHWEFEIKVMKEAFCVLRCELLLNGKVIRYCCNSNDNIFRNITEFREFLKREVLKEDI